MPEDPRLRPATPKEVAETLSFALRYDGRRRVHHADDVMAWITAERLVQHLEQSGYVLMKRPDAAAQTTSSHARSAQIDTSDVGPALSRGSD